MVVKKRERVPEMAPLQAPDVIAVDRFTECHVTPPFVAARMVDYLEVEKGLLCLEPEAGTGNLISALLDSGYDPLDIVAVEWHGNLCASIHERFPSNPNLKIYNQCFLNFATAKENAGIFPRILMNPPFRKVRTHMEAALSLLQRGKHDRAILVALVPITYQHQDAEELETLPLDTFSNTSVYTKIIKIERS